MFKNNKENIKYMSKEEVEKLYEFQKKNFDSKIEEQKNKILELADIVSAFVAWGQGYHNQLVLGGGGIADAAVISGVISVLLCELLGEAIERIVRAQGKQGGRS